MDNQPTAPQSPNPNINPAPNPVPVPSVPQPPVNPVPALAPNPPQTPILAGEVVTPPPQAPAPTPIAQPPEPTPISAPAVLTGLNPPVPPQAATVPSAPTAPRKRFPVMILALIIVIVIAAVGGGAYYMSQRKKTVNVQAQNVKIGLMMAFSGGSSGMGYGTSKGVALAKKQLGANNITVIQADSKCDPKAAVTAINKLIKQHVVAIIGDGCSSASVAALPIANNAEIPLISPSASSTELSIPNDYFFRVIPNDNYQGSFMAKTVYDKGIRTVAIFYTNEPYGTSIEQAFKNKFQSLGGKIVTTAFAQPDVIDLTNQMKAIKATDPQGVFFAPNSQVTGAAAIKLARQAGIKVPLFGADIFYDQSVISNAGGAAEGMTLTTFPTGTSAFKQAIANAYPNDAQLYAAPEAYDAFKAIYLAVQKGATTGAQIKSALPTTNFQGVSAHISFDQNGDLAASNYTYALFQVENGKFVQLN